MGEFRLKRLRCSEVWTIKRKGTIKEMVCKGICNCIHAQREVIQEVTIKKEKRARER